MNSTLPGFSIWELYEQAGAAFPFWVAPWRAGPTIARVFDFHWDRRSRDPDEPPKPPDFAANVFLLDSQEFLSWHGLKPLVVRIHNDGQAGWLPIHVDSGSY